MSRLRSKRVLITGGSGLLALNWACAVRDDWDVVLGTHQHGVVLRGTTAVKLNMDVPEELEIQVEEIAPDLIVHTAGLTNVDRCEEEPGLARRANACVTRNLAQVAAVKKLALVHVSTDHLFAGDRSMRREDDLPEPLNEYARSKLLAEKWVLENSPSAICVRTNFFGWGHANRQSFSDWIIYSLRAGRAISLFDDVFFTPILADTLAFAAHELVDTGASGIFNIVGDERSSKYEFGWRAASQFGLPARLIHRDKVTCAKLVARRPHDMSLDNAKTRHTLRRNLGSLDEYLRALRHQEEQGRREELLSAVKVAT